MTQPEEPLSVEQARALARVAGRVLGRLKRTELRVCQRCGRQFVGTPRAQYCSVNCRTRAWQVRQPDYNVRRRQRRRARHEAVAEPPTTPQP
jgi:hypothetical protein